MNANANGNGRGTPAELAPYLPEVGGVVEAAAPAVPAAAPEVPAEAPPEPAAAPEVPAEAPPEPVAATARVVDGDAGEDGRDRWAPVRATARVAYQTGRGHGVLARRGWDAATHGAVREQVRLARATGDDEALLVWLDQLNTAKAARRQRLKELPETIRAAAVAGLAALTGLAGLLLVLGLAVAATKPMGWTWGEYWGFWAAVADAVTTLAAVALRVAAWAAGPAWLVAAYRAGRTPAGAGPAWALAPGQGDEEGHAIVDAAGIAEAIAHLGIPKLDRAIKDGWRPEFTLQPVRVNGRGYQAAFSLPMGVTPDMMADKQPVLARNLYRHPLEVWLTAAKQAGVVEVWVADAGSADQKAPDYPLLHSGVCDIFSGVPLGVSQRGDEIAPPLFEANFVFGGQMGMGKSNAARVVMLGAALDPLAELWVYVLANNGDFDTYAPRLSRYERGVDDDVVYAAAASLEELYAEVARREARIAELGAKKLTRRIAEKHPDLRPIVALYSECHEMFGYDKADEDAPKKGPTLGELATDYATKTLRRARKVGIILMFDTQSSRKDAIPPKVVELVKLNACFYVKSWRSNDGFLGDGSFQSGIRATELRPEQDRGTSLITGATPERFEILHWYFIPIDDDAGWDAAADVIARTTAVEARPAVEAKTERDEFADVADCMRGEKRVLTTVVVARLMELDSTYYKDWTPGKLRALLKSRDLDARKSGRMYVDADDIRLALTAGDDSGREEDREADEE